MKYQFINYLNNFPQQKKEILVPIEQQKKLMQLCLKIFQPMYLEYQYLINFEKLYALKDITIILKQNFQNLYGVTL